MTLRAKKTARKKEEILRSALSILYEKGYHGTTLEEIAANLLMTKGSIYYYFKDKQELLYHCQLMILEQSIENIKEVCSRELSVTDKLRESMIIHVKYAISEKNGFEMMAIPEQFFQGSQLEKILLLRDDYSSRFDQLIIQGVEEGVFNSIDLKVVRNIILGAMHWVTHWYSPDGEKSGSEIAESVADYLLRIFIKNK
ncbi:TetR/AcrR family transcriptional regulator [Sporosarcina sp. CAU 1771]